MSDARKKELEARLARMMSGQGAPEVRADPRSPRVVVSTGGGMGWVLWLMRGVALLFAFVFALLAPVVSIDCAATGPGVAACTFASSTAWIRPIASERIAGIAKAEATPDGAGVRLLDQRDGVLYERTDSALAGISMVSLAQAVQALVDGTSQAPVRGWQWPLPVALLCAVALLFAASGLFPLLRWIRRAVFGEPSPEARARASGNGASWAFGAVATALGAGLLYVAPVVSYQCESGEGGARCAIERRYAGLVALERVEVKGIARAAATAYTSTRRERDTSSTSREYRTVSESVSTVELYGEGNKLLFQDQQSGAVGTSAHGIADRVSALADGNSAEPFRVWQLPWVPALLASLGLLLGPPMLLVLAFGDFFGVRGRAWFSAATLIGMALALAAGWTLALLGRMPG